MSDLSATPEAIARSIDAQRRRLKALPDNWDGYGAKTLDPLVIHNFTDMIETEGTLVQIVPGGDGSLQAEWHLRGDVDVEFNREPSGEITIYVSYKPTTSTPPSSKDSP